MILHFNEKLFNILTPRFLLNQLTVFMAILTVTSHLITVENKIVELVEKYAYTSSESFFLNLFFVTKQ